MKHTVVQFVDQGIIETIKRFYREQMLLRLLLTTKTWNWISETTLEKAYFLGSNKTMEVEEERNGILVSDIVEVM